MKLSYSALVIAALGFECAIAQPAYHKHHHQHRRTYYDVSGVDFTKIDYSHTDFGSGEGSSSGGEEEPASASPSPSPSSTPSSAPSSSPPSTSSSTGRSSCPSFGSITAPVDNGNKDQYIGNVGQPYGSNMKIVGESDNCDCKYSIKFINNGGASMEAIVWNKSGKDGQPQSGMGSEPNLKIPLGVGESQLVCFDENSQVSFSRNCKRNSVSNIPDCTWGEADFGDLRNGAWSGYDVSSIPNSAGNTENLTITCPKAKTSSQQENSFTDASQEDAGGAVAPGSMAIQAEWQ
ncbi:hypothetical protein MMC29_006377 [Sticta canariensis]|nr:hypothetical protein [Sticta canariensis]